MPRRSTRLSLPILTAFCGACATPEPETRFLTPEIPATLLSAPAAPDPPAGGTLRDLGHYAIGMEQALAACTVQLEEIGGLVTPRGGAIASVTRHPVTRPPASDR